MRLNLTSFFLDSHSNTFSPQRAALVALAVVGALTLTAGLASDGYPLAYAGAVVSLVAWAKLKP